jgi:hypothetical protein
MPGRVARKEACSIDHRGVASHASSIDRTCKVMQLAL